MCSVEALQPRIRLREHGQQPAVAGALAVLGARCVGVGIVGDDQQPVGTHSTRQSPQYSMNPAPPRVFCCLPPPEITRLERYHRWLAIRWRLR